MRAEMPTPGRDVETGKLSDVDAGQAIACVEVPE
jgi:hypothetical protein